MYYKYAKTEKIALQGTLIFHSGTSGDLDFDLTGTYDLEDIKNSLPDDYLLINLDDPTSGEMGLKNVFFGDGNLTGLTIEKETSGFDSDKFNNLLKLLGFSDGRTIYTTDQSYSAVDNLVVSPYMGAKLPLEFSIPGNALACGLSTSNPISIKNGGKDNVSNVGVYSNNYRIRRGEEVTFRGTKTFIDLVDVLKDVYKSPTRWYFPAGYDFYTTKGYILLPHRTFEGVLIYPTIGVREVIISFLEEA